MTKQEAIANQNKTYEAAKRADQVFHAACVKQYGSKRAGDMRYRTSQHNAATMAAYEVKTAADNAMCDANEALRKAV